MKAARSIRPKSDRGEKVSRTVLSVVRILIASYFLATATGLIFEPSSRTFFDAVLSQQNANLVTTVYLFCTAFLIMVGKVVRVSALLLAVYIFWSGFLHYDLAGDPGALLAFWRAMALLGAVLLIAVTEPGGSGKFDLFRKSVAPRRIAVTGTARRVNVERPSSQSSVSTPGLAEPLQDEEDDDAEFSNIFADAWDSPMIPTVPNRA